MTACKSTALGGIWSDRELKEVRNNKEGEDRQGKGSEVKERSEKRTCLEEAKEMVTTVMGDYE